MNAPKLIPRKSLTAEFPCIRPPSRLNRSMELSVEHIGLPARDAKALRDWYITVLGATCIAPNGDGGPFFIKIGDSPTMFEVYTAASANPQTADNSLAGWRHLALRVSSIETTRKMLEQRGVKFPDPLKPAAGGGHVLFFQDLDGNLLHLVERPADSVFAL